MYGYRGVICDGTRVGRGGTSLRLAPNAAAAGGPTLVVALSTGPSTFDPQGNGLLANRLTWDLAYQCLLNTTNAGVIVPELATKYTVSSNGLHYIFTLEAGRSFQNGDPFNSSDVVYTFNRYSRSARHRKRSFSAITSR